MKTREQKDRDNNRSRERYATDPDYRQRKIDRSQAQRDRDKASGNRKKRVSTEQQKEANNDRARFRYSNDPEFKARCERNRQKQVRKNWELPVQGTAKTIIRSARENARRKGIEFTITCADIYIPTHCPIFGIPLFRTAGTITDNSPSIDRIDSSKGYIPGNVQIVSYRANHLKNNATLQEMITLGKWASSVINNTHFEPDSFAYWKEEGDVPGMHPGKVLDIPQGLMRLDHVGDR